MVGVAELRQRLAHYLELAAAGEEIVVTERGRPIARLVAATTASSSTSWSPPGSRIGPPGPSGTGPARAGRSPAASVTWLQSSAAKRRVNAYFDTSALVKLYLAEADLQTSVRPSR